MTNNKEPWVKSQSQKDFDLAIAKLLREKRKAIGYTRNTVLTEINKFSDTGDDLISIDYYGRIERGECSISAYKLILLINYLNSAIEIYNAQNDTDIKIITLDICSKLLQNKL